MSATTASIPDPSQLPNPYTPLAWLDPSIASQFEASRYLYIASLSAYIWDWLSSMSDEYRMLRRRRFSMPMFAYFFSRVTALAYLLTSTIFQVGAVGSCAELQTALGWCFACAVPASASLFYFRVRAVFSGNIFVTIGFGILWIGVLAGCILVPFAITGEHIGTTNRCINSKVQAYSSTGIVINTCYDAIIFGAISWRLVANHDSESRMKAFTSGSGLPRFTRSVIQSGQLYFLVTVGINILTMAMILSQSVPPVIHAMFTIPNVALENAMTTRVFRAVALGAIKDVHTSTGRLGPALGASDVTYRRPNPHSRDRHGEGLFSDSGIEMPRAVPMVNVHVEVGSDSDSLGKEVHDIKSRVDDVV